MTLGAPLLLSDNMSASPLSPVAVRNDSGQAIQECVLQEVIDRWPSILEINQFYPNVESLCSLGREIPVPIADGQTGFIDNLLVTDDAHLVIVETKLWRNPEALRSVIAQALQYSMALSKLSHEELESHLRRADARGQRLGADESIFERVSRLLQGRADDFEDAFDRLRRNGDILLLIVGDRIRSSAECLVEWMNKVVGSAPYKLGLMELRFYELSDSEKIIVPRTLLKISEASRHVHVVTINLVGAAKEQVTATITAPSGSPTTIGAPAIPLTEEGLTSQIRAKNPPEIAELAEAMRSRLTAIGLKTRGFPSCINYGIDVNGEFITLLSVTATNIWMAIPLRAVRALGDQRFIACKQRINNVGIFYRPEDVSDPTKTTALGPRFQLLDGKVEAFAEAVGEVAETVRGAMVAAS